MGSYWGVRFFIIVALLLGAFDSRGVILGDLEWDDVNEYEFNNPIRMNSLAIGDIYIPLYKSQCTGFLISPNVVMTNHHCIATRFHTWELQVTFSFIAGIDDNAVSTYNCRKFIGANKTLDYALIECENSPGSLFGYLDLDSTDWQSPLSIYIPQQNCDYNSEKKCRRTQHVSYGSLVETERRLEHNADTLAGSSGAPIIALDTHKVVGIHYAGVKNKTNYGQKSSLIYKDMVSNYAHVLERPPSLGPEFPKLHFSMAAAWPISSTPATFPYVPVNSGRHYYKISKPIGRLLIQIEASMALKVKSIHVYNKNGIRIAWNDNMESANQLSFSSLNGDYWIELEFVSQSYGHYSLSIN